jgi:hypothetical protein
VPQRLEAYKACKRADETEGIHTPLPPEDGEKDPEEGGGGAYPSETSARLHASEEPTPDDDGRERFTL